MPGAMISYEEAERIARERIGSDCLLVPEATTEKPYGWYFMGQGRRFAETGDVAHLPVGGGGFLVEREGGRVVEFGSAYPPERWLAMYEKGFKYDRYDLTVAAVSDLGMAVDLLAKLGLRYVEPEEAFGTVWVVPKAYTPDRLRELLATPPVTFADQSLLWPWVVDVFDEVDAAGCCTYELREHRPREDD